MLSWLEIDSSALRHNYHVFCDLVGKDHCALVLKSNAYGHGLAETLTALLPESPAWICVNYVEEALSVRDLGFKGRILVVGPAFADGFETAKKARAELVIGNADVLKAWLADEPEKIPVHLKFDTGLSRQGFFPEEFDKVLTAVGTARTNIVGISMHFANVEDVMEHDYAETQMQRFDAVLAKAKAAGLNLIRHAASSASTLLIEKSRYDLARVGIALYGLWPSKATRLSFLQLHTKVVELKPALTWRTRIATVKGVKAGDFIGYGCSYRAFRDMRVAVLPVGYYEGFPRKAGDHSSYVLINQQRCPLVGRISMNMMVVDVSHLKLPQVGDVVTLIGRDGTEYLSAEDVAGWAETIHYELVTRINAALPRRLV